MISMTVSIYFGMNDIMVNRYPYDTDISITGVGEEECQTAIETFEKAISDNKVPVDKKAEEIYLTIISRIDHGQIQIAEPGTLTESGSVLTLSLLRQSEYKKLTGTNPALQDGEILAWASKMTEKSDSLTVNDSVFSVKKWLENSPLTVVAISSIEMQYLLSLILILKSLIKCEQKCIRIPQLPC